MAGRGYLCSLVLWLGACSGSTGESAGPVGADAAPDTASSGPADVVSIDEGDATATEDGQSVEDVVAIEDDVPVVPDDTVDPDVNVDVVEPDDVEPLADTAVEDVVASDLAEPDIAPEVEPTPVECSATVAITAPVADEFFASTSDVTATAQVVSLDAIPLTELTVRWTLIGGPELGVSPVMADGSSTWTGPIPESGKRTLRARVQHQTGSSCAAEPATIDLHVCKAYLYEAFGSDLDPLAWAVSGDGYWESQGWLEMTGLSQGRKGAIYSTTPQVTPGDVSIRFRYATGGGGDSTGADGFAATFMKAEDLAEMVSWVQAGDGGGGLGYGAGGPYGAFTGSAFTVEIDTWYNQQNDAEYHTDPTSADHLELTQGLDPSASIGFYALPDIETLEWHSIRVDIAQTHVKVIHDGVLALDIDIPDFEFRGGYIFFSGSTGYYYNYHRFDDLEIFHGCLPGPL
jgi:hypothetical protein